jgi:hypothetical protein
MSLRFIQVVKIKKSFYIVVIEIPIAIEASACNEWMLAETKEQMVECNEFKKET